MDFEYRTDDISEERPDELPDVTPSHGGPAPRQRSPRTDPSMMDGNSSHGNPYEMEGEELTTDNDVGDMKEEVVTAGFDGGAAGGTTADMRSDVDDYPADDEEGESGVDLLDDGDRADDAPPAVEDVLPHPAVAAGADGSTTGSNRPAAEVVPAREPRGRVGSSAGNLPIEGYDKLTVPQVLERVADVPAEDLRLIRDHEENTRNRKTLLAKLDRLIDGGPARRSKVGAAAGE